MLILRQEQAKYDCRNALARSRSYMFTDRLARDGQEAGWSTYFQSTNCIFLTFVELWDESWDSLPLGYVLQPVAYLQGRNTDSEIVNRIFP